MGNRLHLILKIVIVAQGLVSKRHAAAADDFTRPPFAHPESLLQTAIALRSAAGASLVLLQYPGDLFF